MALGHVEEEYDLHVAHAAWHESMWRRNFDLHVAHAGAVGLYVPGGTAVLPSSTLMLAVPAGIAGCKTIVMATPPRGDGQVWPAIPFPLVCCAKLAAQRASVLPAGSTRRHACQAPGLATLVHGSIGQPMISNLQAEMQGSLSRGSGAVLACAQVTPEVLYCAKRAGVTHVLKAGGAQAVAAMAWGTASCPKVCGRVPSFNITPCHDRPSHPSLPWLFLQSRAHLSAGKAMHCPCNGRPGSNPRCGCACEQFTRGQQQGGGRRRWGQSATACLLHSA